MAFLIPRVLFLALLGVLLVLPAAPANGQPLFAIQGEDIPLQGIATGTDVVYLFLTGPNLPPQGISLAGGTPVITGDPSSFTRADVLTGGTWSYTWRTGELGRVLDEGSYTVYAIGEPRAFPDLDDAPYTTRAIVFAAPVETVTGTVPGPITGSLFVNSTPGMATVSIDGILAGVTPLQVPAIPAGTYALVIAREGYGTDRLNVTVSPGEETVVNVMLPLLTPSPSGGTPSMTGTTPPAPAPVTPLVPAVAAALAVLCLRRSR